LRQRAEKDLQNEGPWRQEFTHPTDAIAGIDTAAGLGSRLTCRAATQIADFGYEGHSIVR
jgi:hypothetical protein